MHNNEFAISIDQFEAAQAEIYQVLTPTPQINWPLLDAHCGTKIWVKHENQLPTGSFKVRGGLIYAQRIKQALGEFAGVVAATRGNHGQSVAFAARRHGMHAVVVVPTGNNPDKNKAMRAYGAELIEHGADFDDALAYARKLSRERNLILFPSFDPSLVCGVGTYAIELLTAQADLRTIYVPVGLGSGICGVIAARDALKLKTKVVGVVSENADAYAQSFSAGRPIATESAQTLADGLAVRVPDPRALEVIRAGAERVVTVSDAEILDAIRTYFSTTHNVAEAAGAAPLAALIKDAPRDAKSPVGLILSGSNIDGQQFAQILTGREF